MLKTKIMENEKSNKLIAEFMEWKETTGEYDTPHSVCVLYPPETLDDYSNIIPPNLMGFESSWDWLMPVVEKIALMYHKTEIISDEETDYCRITVYKEDSVYSHEIFECGLSTMEATSKAVVEFIKWHNKQTNK